MPGLFSVDRIGKDHIAGLDVEELDRIGAMKIFFAALVAVVLLAQSTPEERGQAAAREALARIHREVETKANRDREAENTCHHLFALTSETRMIELTAPQYFAIKACVDAGLYQQY